MLKGTKMRNLALMWVLAGCLLGCGGGGDSDGLTWYCGPEKKPRAVKAVLKDGTLTVSGKGAMNDFLEPLGRGLLMEPWGRNLTHYDEQRKELMKAERANHWPPWYFTLEYDSTILITSVIIGEGVTHIGDMAFAGLPELQHITIPASVSSIGGNALVKLDLDCCGDVSNLTSITVAAANANYSSEDGVLFNKNKTTLILYPRDKQQNAYTIPNSVTTIEKRAFYRCKNLTSVIIPNSVTSIEDSTFFDCMNLTSVTIPNNVTFIGDEVFNGCTSLTSITIPNSVTSIGNGAFSYCYGLMSVTIPNSVTSIGNGAFFLCYGLTSVTIPNRMTYIGNKMFDCCTSLTSVTIPNSVTHIKERAFSACPNLMSIIVQNPIPPNLEGDVFDEISHNACLYVPKGSIDAYRAADGWKFNCIKPIASAPK